MIPGSGVHQCRTKLPMRALHSLATRVGQEHYGDQGILMEISVSWIPETNQEISFSVTLTGGNTTPTGVWSSDRPGLSSSGSEEMTKPQFAHL